MKTIHVLLADDHQIVREGLKLLVDSQPDMRVVAEAGNGVEVLRQVKTSKPDVIIMDLTMPELNGLQATERLRQDFPEIKVIALTVHEDENYLRKLCQAGASGYVLKRSAGDELVNAIHKVMDGGVYFDASLASKVLVTQLAETHPGDPPHHFELSDREKEVLVLFAWGHSNKEIAAKLNISVKTVETYRARIGEKLNLKSRTDIVRYALLQGWLKEDASGLTG